jgi:hypothetical protein
MKTKKPFLRLAAFAALSFFTGNEIVAQTNLGAACGCPAVGSRPTKLITLANGKTWTALPSAAYGKELQGNQSVVLSCDTTWLLNEKLYVGSGSTLTIQPGTVIKGTPTAAAAEARALVIERGGKIIAPGVEECPIVFTAQADDLSGSYPINNKGMWGGVLLCGTATNNLTLALNGPFVPGQQGKIAAATGLGVLEGFASSYPQDQFGANLSGATGYTLATSPSSATYTFDLSLGTQASSTGASGQSVIRFSSSSLAAYAIVGTSITGTGIAPGTTVTGVSSADISISQALTATAAGSYTFTNTYPQAPGTSGNYFAVSSTPTFANNTYGPFDVAGGLLNYAAPYIGTTGITAFNDNDNSGIMTHVSIRHAGANLLVGSEINGLTLASVGRGTKIEHIEIVSCADDNIEIFGGTVNLKYCTTLFGNDDMYDYDLGWTGKAQFLFGMKANQAGTPVSVSVDNDNGFEADGGDNNQLLLPSNPTIYNATIMGNGKSTPTADNRGLSAMNFKDGAQGTINNSVFANFKNGLCLTDTQLGSGSVGLEHNSWENWTTDVLSPAAANPQSLKVKCNTFVDADGSTGTRAITYNVSSSSANSSTLPTTALAQFTADNNLEVADAAAITAGFSYAFAINGTTNAITTKNDVVPNTGVAAFQLGSGCAQAPMDGFFAPANYRGAFAPSANNENWLSDWTYSQVLNSTNGVTACPTDINNDGTTDVNDFLIFSGQFGQACN